MADDLEQDDAFEATDSLRVLVVDDSPVDRRLAQRVLQKSLDAEILEAADGLDAVELLKAEQPDLILSDLQMPRMDGLSLLRTVREMRRAPIPFIVMTARGSEEIAIAALQLGADSYIAKRQLAADLDAAVRQVLNASEAGRYDQFVDEHQTAARLVYELPNDRTLVESLARRVVEAMHRMGIVDDGERIRATVAIAEAVRNAIDHGNLEIGPALRADPKGKSLFQLYEERRTDPRYAGRRVSVVVELSRQEAKIRIRDDGPGFDRTLVPDSKAALVADEGAAGRGLVLIRSFMDQVEFNEAGNEIVLKKRRPAARAK